MARLFRAVSGAHPEAGCREVIYVGFLLGHGGDALQMLTLADGVQKRGARVSLVLPAGTESAEFADRCRLLGLHCERSPLLSAKLTGVRQNPFSMLRLFGNLPRGVLHLHSGNDCLPRAALLALELLRYPRAIATLQSPHENLAPGGTRARTWALLARRRLSAVVSPSGHATRFQQRCGVPASLTTTVPNAVDAAAMSCGDPSGPRALLGIDSGTPVVLFASRLDGQKRPVDAVRAFAAVAQEFPTAILVMAGRGDHADAVQQAASASGVRERVRMVGYQTNVADWLATASVWILPTERENFSIAVLEALAAGCPVVATDCPGNDEVLVDGENALTFAVADVDGAAAALRRVLRDPLLRRSLSTAGRATARRYTSDAMVESYLALYRRCYPAFALAA